MEKARVSSGFSLEESCRYCDYKTPAADWSGKWSRKNYLLSGPKEKCSLVTPNSVLKANRQALPLETEWACFSQGPDKLPRMEQQMISVALINPLRHDIWRAAHIRNSTIPLTKSKICSWAAQLPATAPRLPIGWHMEDHEEAPKHLHNFKSKQKSEKIQIS